ncbi:ABC transporter permease/M1 family aminopeptidase [Planctomycetota bacterium]
MHKSGKGIFAAIFMFEIKRGLKSISSYVYFLVMFALAFLMVCTVGGSFANATASFGIGEKVLGNSPYSIFLIVSALSYYGLLIIAAIMGEAGLRDFHHQTHELIFSKPITKFQYLGGRFAGALGVTLVVFSSIPLGGLLATYMPWLDADKMGPHNPLAYLYPFLVTVIPNLLFTGAIFFGIAALFRKNAPVYVCCVILLFGYIMATAMVEQLGQNIVMENQTTAALIDPFGFTGLDIMTRYWTISEKNTLYIPPAGVFLANRIFWLVMGFLIFAFVSYRFKFSYKAPEKKIRKKVDPGDSPPSAITYETIPSVSPITFTWFTRCRQLYRLAVFSFLKTIKSAPFQIIMLIGALNLILMSFFLDDMMGTQVYPVTYSILNLTTGSFFLFVIIIITLYSGEMVWQDRDNRIHQIMDAQPVPDWILFASRVLALIMIQIFLLAVIMICGILIQASEGYTNFELSVYVRELFGFQLMRFSLLCALAVFIQSLSPHKYLGHFIMVLYYLASMLAPSYGYEYGLYRYGYTPSHTLSHMNGFGHFVMPILYFSWYWACVAVLLAIFSKLFFVRGIETRVKQRCQMALNRFTMPTALLTGLIMVIGTGIGYFIYYNTRILNKYQTSKSREIKIYFYEKTYKEKYSSLPQPRIVDVQLQLDLFPEKRDFAVKSTFILKNKTEQPIKTLFIQLPAPRNGQRISKTVLDQDYREIENDSTHGVLICELDTPLAPQDNIQLDYAMEYTSTGFENRGSNTAIVYNGSFLHSTSILPGIGYDPGKEIPGQKTRIKYGLSPLEMPEPDDPVGRSHSFISRDADRVKYKIEVSTSPDQIAIAPGILHRKWTKDGRRYFEYKMDRPILNFFAFLSARYEVKCDQWRDIPIEIFYHPGHEYNLDRMVKGIKKTLEYCTQNFSPYAYQQVRIVEFPRYSRFAQAFAGTIPYSESIGFIAKVDPNDEDGIDYPYYVTAHEMGHQWWAHQVIGGNVKGSQTICESLAQYTALMVMKNEFGKEKMRKFLLYELDRYLKGRSFEAERELPLTHVDYQGYVWYNKGSLVMYALQDYIGEEQLNKALAKYIQDTAYQEAPYTNSLEFLEYIREVTPESLQYIIEDMFETITLYENRAVTATCVARAANCFEVKLVVEAKKFRSDELGKEEEIPVNDLIDIGIMDKDGNELYFAKHKIDQDKMEFTITVDKKPDTAGIDPYNKLIDRKPYDNVTDIEF